MTYIEKLMSAVKFDDEMLTPCEIERLSGIIASEIADIDCPYMYGLLRKCGAEVPEGIKETGNPGDCGMDGDCEACWAQEIPA